MKLEYNGEQLECIALPLRRIFAEQILSGEKTMETRNEGTFIERLVIDQEAREHNDRICAKIPLKVLENMTAEDIEKYGILDEVKQIEAIHFYDRAKGAWHLYVLVDDNGFARLTPKDIRDAIPEEYDFHEYDEFAKEYADKVENDEWTIDDVPCIYWFHISGIISSRGLERHITDVNPDTKVNITGE